MATYSVRYTQNGDRLRIRVDADNHRDAQRKARGLLPEHTHIVIEKAYLVQNKSKGV